MTNFQKAAIKSGAFTLPGYYYTAATIFQEEMERIFTSRWTLVGRVEQIPAPGDYFLVKLSGESMIVVRDRDGAVRAFFNVCRHRGTQLCTAEQGHFSETIQCPYHAWTFGLDGRLITARVMQDAPDFDKADYPLHTAAIAEWEGFLFLNLAPKPEPFATAFAPLIGRLPQWRMATLQVGHRIEYDVQANWKMIVQNYSECYHCPLVHPALAALSPWQSGRNDLSEGPFLGGYMDLNHASMTTSGQTTRPPLGKVDGADLSRVYYYSIFPNMLLSMHPDYVMVHTLWPQATGQTQIVCEWLFDPATMAQPGFDPSDAVEFWDMTNRQDWHVCELSQLGVASRVYTPGPYAQQEGLLWAFDQYYLEVMNEEL
ncbi:MAG: aromatic ring-hydroxylating dioxygenase subunit alpha [Chloroflexales bacterium]|nr:aromatic ring-hydroxylating dioxygenase subunit alpha [Chloroflexales bacterium]